LRGISLCYSLTPMTPQEHRPRPLFMSILMWSTWCTMWCTFWLRPKHLKPKPAWGVARVVAWLFGYRVDEVPGREFAINVTKKQK
jgi:hypothetical protein